MQNNLSRRIDLVRQVREEYRRSVGDASAQLPIIERREASSFRKEAAPVAMLSDLHVGEDRNSLDVAEASLRSYFGAVVWLNDLYRQSRTLRDMVFVLGGGSDLAPVDTIVWLYHRLVDGFDHLLRDFELDRIVVPCVAGRHGRSPRMIVHKAGSSYEWLLYQMLAVHYADEPRIEFYADQSPHKYLKVYGQIIHVCHGDDMPVEAGGLAAALEQRIPIWNQLYRADVHVVAHFHDLAVVGDAVVNGSFVGDTPEQGYFLVDSRRGRSDLTRISVR